MKRELLLGIVLMIIKAFLPFYFSDRHNIDLIFVCKNYKSFTQRNQKELFCVFFHIISQVYFLEELVQDSRNLLIESEGQSDIKNDSAKSWDSTLV